MKHISIREANNLYISMGYGTIHKHKVHHVAFRDFCMTIVKLERDLDDQHIQDDFWNGFLREVKYYRFLLHAAPLPVSTYTAGLLLTMQDKIKQCHYIFPNFVAQVQSMFDILSILSSLNDNPLLDTLAELVPLDEHYPVGLLLKEAYLFSAVEKLLEVHPLLKHVELVNQYQLRGPQCYRNLFVIGPSYWYPEYILRSPRSKDVHLIRYNWLTDRWKPSPIFERPFTLQQSSKSNNKLVEVTHVLEHDDQEVLYASKEQDILPEINWSHITARLLRQVVDDSNQELVPARLYLLANDQSVFLDAGEDARAFVLDLEVDEDEEEELQQVKRVQLSKIRPGMFLVLRTEGGGDYIISVADKMLREKAVHLRAMQEEWKALLRKAVLTKGALTVSVELLDFGSQRANEVNVRYWMSSRSIRPQDDKDFRAILRLTNLQHKAQEYLDAAKQIKYAHNRAGFYIRDQLLKQVEIADFQELHRNGFLSFELPESYGGSLTALRLENISPESFTIPASRIGRLTKIKGLSWRE